MKIAFAGFFAIRLAALVRAHLSVPCDVVEDDETAILPQLGDADFLGHIPSRRLDSAAPRMS